MNIIKIAVYDFKSPFKLKKQLKKHIKIRCDLPFKRPY